MESVNEIKEQLSACSRTATLDELANEGRKRVRLIRAEHIAQMISEAVHAAVEDSGLVGQEEVDALVAKSREEFQNVLREREQELQEARENEAQLEASEQQVAELNGRLDELTQALALSQSELQQVKDELVEARQEVATDEEVQPQAGVPPELMMSMMQELANLKASVAQQPTDQQGGPDFAAALDKLAGTLNDRLDTFGKKMGISSAVGGDAPVDFGSMFQDDGADDLESNMDNIQVKQKAGGGIAANLAKLKKLKGGG